MRQLNIIQVISSPWWTGAAEPALSLTEGLGKRGHKMHFVCVGGDVLEERAGDCGYPRIEGVDPTRNLSPSRIWKSVGALSALIDKTNADIIHAHLSADHWLSFFSIRRAKCNPRLVRTVHHPRSAKPGVINKYLLGRGTDTVICVNNHIEGILKNQLQVTASRVHVVRGGVDIERFCPASIESRDNGRIILESPDKALLIGIVSRLAPDRGYMTLLDAFSVVASRAPQVCLVIIGKGEYLHAIKERVAELGLINRVLFPGYIEKKLPEALSALDVFILMAPGSEGTSRALLEAMAMGISCVVTSYNGLEEVVRDGVTAYVVPPNDSGALVAALQTLIDDKEKRDRFGQAGRQRAERHFHNGCRAEIMEKIYANLLDIALFPRKIC